MTIDQLYEKKRKNCHQLCFVCNARCCPLIKERSNEGAVSETNPWRIVVAILCSIAAVGIAINIFCMALGLGVYGNLMVSLSHEAIVGLYGVQISVIVLLAHACFVNLSSID